jgi:hypothetical protein
MGKGCALVEFPIGDDADCSACGCQFQDGVDRFLLSVEDVDNPISIKKVRTHSLTEGRLAVCRRSVIYALNASVSMPFQLPAALSIPSRERVTSSGLSVFSSLPIRSSRNTSPFFSRRIGLTAASVSSLASSLPSGTLIFFVGSFTISIHLLSVTRIIAYPGNDAYNPAQPAPYASGFFHLESSLINQRF